MQSLPEINLDAYKVCLPPRWRPGELSFAGISVTFGTPLPSDSQHNFTFGVLMHFASRAPLLCGIIDLLTFLIIFTTARGSRARRLPGIPSILDVIARDATIYFLLIAVAQLVLFLFLFFAPVSDPYYTRGRLSLLYSSFVTCSDANSAPARGVGFHPPRSRSDR